jgi:xanthine dehydrogenase accessory factor
MAGRHRAALVRGSGDVGSAVAHALYCSGYRVLIHDEPRPPHTRRGMAFANALFGHTAELAGVLAKRQADRAGVAAMIGCGRAIPVATGAVDDWLSLLEPDILVDARMRKRAVPERQRGLARLAVGLGPNFVAGGNADVVVETAWGDDLGRVIREGPARPFEGEPREIAGHARDRYVYAPAAGLFCTGCEIGQYVEAGAEVACIDALVLRAPLGGRLRGLTHTDIQVARGTKVIEIDPRGADADIYGIGERPRRIAAGVLNAVAA